MTQSIQDCINKLQTELDDIDSVNWVECITRKLYIQEMRNRIRGLKIAQVALKPRVATYNYDELGWIDYDELGWIDLEF
jgi:hypothetical protein